MQTASSTAHPEVGQRRALRVLFLTPFPPRLDATHGGGQVLGQVIYNLAERHCAGVIYLRGHDEPAIDPAVSSRCERVWEIALPQYGPGGVKHWIHRLRVMRELIRGYPEWATNWNVPAFYDCLKLAIEEWSPDVIQVEYSVMGRYLQGMSRHHIPSVLTVYEPAAHAATERALRPRRRAIQLLLDRRAWKRYERDAVATADAVVVFTDRDRKNIRKLSPKAQIVCIPLGSDLTGQPLDPLGSTPNSIIFIGNFSHRPNVDAAERLVHSIFPKVQKQIPDATLTIVGDRVPDALRRMATESIVVTGWVPSVTPYLNRAAVVAAPIRIGGGMRVKVLEALVAGKAIVASPRAVEGIDVQAGVHFMLAGNDQQFADEIMSILEHDDLRMEVATNARSWAMANLGWGHATTLYDDLYSSLMQPVPVDESIRADYSANEPETQS